MMPALDGEQPNVHVVIKAKPIPEPALPPAYQPTEDEELAAYLLSLRACLQTPAPVPESYEGKARRLEAENLRLLDLIENRLKRMDVPYTDRSV